MKHQAKPTLYTWMRVFNFMATVGILLFFIPRSRAEENHPLLTSTSSNLKFQFFVDGNHNLIENHEQNVGPRYTARMLLSDIHPPYGIESLPFKPFSHFTLGCTLENRDNQISHAFNQLADFLEGPITFTAEAVINLGSEERPLWGVKLDLGSKKHALRDLLGILFDSSMSPERNGILYLWKPVLGAAEKSPHITLGPKDKDQETAYALVDKKYEFTFSQIDYKKVGPHNSLVSHTLQSKPHLKANI